MKQIAGRAVVSSNDSDVFRKQMDEWIIKLQSDGQEVEIQFSTDVIDNNINNKSICYSALVIGRKEE